MMPEDPRQDPWSHQVSNDGSGSQPPVVQSLSRDPMDGSTPGFPVLHHLLDLAQTHVC